MGDLLLVEVADRLKSCVREMDTAARFGGDELVASIGIVLFIHRDASREDILKWAATAMYQAKEDGCNLIRFYE